MSTNTLEDYIAKIDTLADDLRSENPREFSHNIVSLTLSTIDEELGQAAAITAITECGLEDLGWSIPAEVTS